MSSSFCRRVTLAIATSLAMLLVFLPSSVAAMRAAIQSQSTITAGLRWDLAPNMALKLQHERITTPSGSRGMLINSVPDFVSGRTAQVSSAALDFVF